MYMDNASIYTDFVPFDMNVLQKEEPFKQVLPDVNDSWLAVQAGISNIQFSDIDISNTDLLEGRLSPSMEKVVNSLLPIELPLPLTETFDVDAVVGFGTQNNDILEGLEVEASSTHHPQMVTKRRRSKRLNKPTSLTAPLDPCTSATPQPCRIEDVLPLVYSNDGYEIREGVKGARKRRPKVSFSTLTDEEKYQRIRDQNNEASKLYREKKRNHSTSLNEMEERLTERNAVLRAKAEGLEKLKDEMQAYTNNFIKQHMRNSGIQ